MRHAADTAQKTAGPGNTCNRQRASDSRPHARARKHLRDATGNTRHRYISCAAISGQRTTSSMREALYSTTSAQHGTDATHKMQHTTGAAASSKHTRNRQHAAGNALHGMRGSRTLVHLEAARAALESRPGKDSEPSDQGVQRFDGAWRCLRRSSPTPTHTVCMRASPAN